MRRGLAPAIAWTCAGGLFLANICLPARSKKLQAWFRFPVDVVVPVAPIPFQAGGKTHLVYELHLTNMDLGDGDCELSQLDVRAEPGGKLLKSFKGGDLRALLWQPGIQPEDVMRISAGRRAVLFLWITLESNEKAPMQLEHRLTILPPGPHGPQTVDCARVAIQKVPVTIGPPLRGGVWAARNGPSSGSGHRTALIPVGGRARVSTRFATDWSRLDEHGSPYRSKSAGTRNQDVYGHGAEVLAVADATVAAVKDGIPENDLGQNNLALTLETLAGNSVVLDLGGGCFAFYVHLQPGKIRVRTGDVVKRGQVLGLLGNSGNSTGPHLHFQLGDSVSLPGSEGVPYHIQAFEARMKPGGPVGKHTLEMPLEDWLIRFPQ